MKKNKKTTVLDLFKQIIIISKIPVIILTLFLIFRGSTISLDSILNDFANFLIKIKAEKIESDYLTIKIMNNLKAIKHDISTAKTPKEKEEILNETFRKIDNSLATWRSFYNQQSDTTCYQITLSKKELKNLLGTDDLFFLNTFKEFTVSSDLLLPLSGCTQPKSYSMTLSKNDSIIILGAFKNYDEDYVLRFNFNFK